MDETVIASIIEQFMRHKRIAVFAERAEDVQALFNQFGPLMWADLADGTVRAIRMQGRCRFESNHHRGWIELLSFMDARAPLRGLNVDAAHVVDPHNELTEFLYAEIAIRIDAGGEFAIYPPRPAPMPEGSADR